MDSNINYIPQIDYTSKDYTAIREDLLALIPQFTPQWTSRDPSDLGMTLVELFSYLGDLMSFYTDRAANEGFLATASQRNSVMQIARMLGYVPTASIAASADLTFSNTTASNVTIPAGTQVATTTVVNGVNTQIIFETTAALVVPAKSGSTPGTAAVAALQGYTVADLQLDVSSGRPSQAYKIVDSPIIQGSISITVGTTTYNSVASLLDVSAYDPAFSTTNDAFGNTFVVFGDGVHGAIPPVASTIYVSYRVGAGVDGNVPAGALTSIISTGIPGGITVNNQYAAAGGANEESTESVRVNAPRALRALTRAVSLKDYSNLALQVTGVAKASAAATTANNIVLYIAPFGTKEAGVVGGEPTTLFTALADKVSAYFVSKAAPNVTLSVQIPDYQEVDANLTVHVLPQYKQSVVITQALSAVRELLSEANTFFGDVIPAQYILTALNGIPGVDYATIELLRLNLNEQQAAVNSWTRASNIVTLSTTTSHTITVGQSVLVSGVAAAVNGTHVVTAVGSTSVSFGNVGTNSGPNAISPAGTVAAQVVETIQCSISQIPTAGTINVSAVGGIQ